MLFRSLWTAGLLFQIPPHEVRCHFKVLSQGLKLMTLYEYEVVTKNEELLYYEPY